MTPPLMDLAELAVFLKVSKRKAQDLAKAYPCFALGGTMKRYDPREVLAYLRRERARQEQHAEDTAGLHPRKLKSVA